MTTFRVIVTLVIIVFTIYKIHQEVADNNDYNSRLRVEKDQASRNLAEEKEQLKEAREELESLKERRYSMDRKANDLEQDECEEWIRCLEKNMRDDKYKIDEDYWSISYPKVIGMVLAAIAALYFTWAATWIIIVLIVVALIVLGLIIG